MSATSLEGAAHRALPIAQGVAQSKEGEVSGRMKRVDAAKDLAQAVGDMFC